MKNFLHLLFLVAPLSSVAQFVETTSNNDIELMSTNSVFGNGTSFIDFNEDGWDDLTLASYYQGIKFYQNNNGTFSEITLCFSPAIPTTLDIKGILWIDYDNDGDKDFIYSSWGESLKVYINDGYMNFEEIGQSIGILPEVAQMGGISAGDYNNDGCLDLFIAKYHNAQVNGYQYSNRLYMNDCNGGFVDMTVSAGLGTSIQASFGSIWLDYNMDGFQDLYVYNDRIFFPNFMYKNNGNGTFTNVTASCGAGIYIDAMSATSDDYDNDCDMDIFVSNSPDGNALLRYNNQTQFFVDVAETAGVSANVLCWGAMWLDYDNDTWQDLFVATMGVTGSTELQNQFYINDQDGTFHLGIVEVGIVGDIDATYTCAMGDYNKDGYFDYATNNVSPTPSSLWMNDGGENNWLSVSVEGTLSNKNGIGTWITCHSGTNDYLRYTFCGENHMGQNSENEIFGLGTQNSVDSLSIKWLSGLEETYYDLAINQHHHFIEGQSFASQTANVFPGVSVQMCEGDSVLLSVEQASEYAWSNGSDTQSIVITSPGEFFVTITDSFGFVQVSDTISVGYYPVSELNILENDISCHGMGNGSIELLMNGIPPDSVIWSLGYVGSSLDGLGPDKYSFMAFDENGCSITGEVNISQPEELNVELDYNNVLCYGDSSGSAWAEVSGGSLPYSLEWTISDTTTVSAGEYYLLVTDGHLCLWESWFEIVEPTEILLDLELQDCEVGNSNGSAALSVTGGIEPYTILWSNGVENFDEIGSLQPGEYSVNVTDSVGCIASAEFAIGIVDGMLESSSGQEIIAYPNPAKNQIHVEFPNTSQATTIKVIDLASREIISNAVVPGSAIQTIDISGLSKGIYYLRVLGSDAPPRNLRFLKL